MSKVGYGFTHLLVRNPPNSLFDCVWICKTIISIYMFELEFKQPFSLIRIGFEEFLYKGNVRVLGEMLSKIFETHVFVLAITWSLLIQIE